MAIKEKREKPLVQVEDGAGNGADRRAWHLAESVALKEKAHPERALKDGYRKPQGCLTCGRVNIQYR